MNVELVAILVGPIAAVAIGEWLRNRNYKKRQKDDLLRRIIHFGYQLSPTYTGSKNEILGAMNEIKFWYFNDSEIKRLTFEVMDAMKEHRDAQDLLIGLLQSIAQREGRILSRQDIERVFSVH